MLPRTTQPSNRPRVSDRTMVGPMATTLLAGAQKQTEPGRTIWTPPLRHGRCSPYFGRLCCRCTRGLDVRNLLRGREEKCFYLTSPFIEPGKESNSLEEVEAGTIHSVQSVYTEYPDPRRDEWQTKIVPALKKLPVAAIIHLSGKSRSMLVRALAGRSRPRRKNQQLLASIVRRLGAI
jgi:hypothetical protein